MMFGTRLLFPYVACEACGCWSLVANEESLFDEYSPGYYSMQEQGQRGWRRRLAHGRDRYYLSSSDGGRRWGWALSVLAPNPRLAVFRRFGIPAEGSILDFGSGAGAFPAAVGAVDAFSRVVGCDSLLDGRIEGNGFTLVPGGFEQFGDTAWDVITMNHSFEHVEDPVRTLRQAAEILAPSGTVVVRVPTQDSVAARLFGRCWYQIDAPRHRSIHRRSCFERLAGDAGLEVIGAFDDSNWRQFGLSALYASDSLPAATGLGLRVGVRLVRPMLSALAAVVNRLGQGDQIAVAMRRPARDLR